MRRFFKTIFSFILVASTFLACAPGGGDEPFIFTGSSGNNAGGGSSSSGGPGGDISKIPPPPACTSNTQCSSGQICQSGKCVTSTAPACTSDTSCSSGLHCNTTSGQCVTCLNNSQCSSGQVCNTATNSCGLSISGACEVNFNATLVLKIDDAEPPTPSLKDHRDSPSECCQYADQNASSTCPSTVPTGGFLPAPSENKDLYCCSAQQEQGVLSPGNDRFGNEIFCDRENRHGDRPEVAATRWKNRPLGRIRMKFLISENGSTCRVAILRDQFGEYQIENSALDGSIIIDAGKNYQSILTPDPNTGQELLPTKPLNPEEVVGDCVVTGSGGGFQVQITHLPMRFFAAVYKNSTQCREVFADTPQDIAACGEPFKTLFDVGSYQVIPGFKSDPLSFGTGSKTVNEIKPNFQKPMTLSGDPLHFEAGSTHMSLVTALSLPSPSGSARDDEKGIGQLQVQLHDALLTAELAGTVTKLDGSAIQTLADLTTNCGSGGGGGGGGGGGVQALQLSMQTTFGSVQETLTVQGDPAKPSEPFTAEACVPGQHQNGSCAFSQPSDLPFAKNTTEGDPQPGTDGKFVKEGTLTVKNQATSGVSVVLQVPDTQIGAFRISNANALHNITLAPGQDTNLTVQFEPKVNAAGCTTASGVIDCQAQLPISSSHSITIALKGKAKLPVPEIRMEEIDAASSNALATILPANPVSPIIFEGETRFGSTRNKLYRLSNTGVRNLTINSFQAQDGRSNFRLGSVYQGPNFAGRVWSNGQTSWIVPPTGANDFFFFLNYGPVGQTANSHTSTRPDAAVLAIGTNAGTQGITLNGIAKKDTRAMLALLIQDEKRSIVRDQTGDIVPDGTIGGKPFYLPKDRVFSFRQDRATREVYLENKGGGSGIDELVIQGIQFNPDTGNRFVFVENTSDSRIARCRLDAASSTPPSTPCATLSAGSEIKLGTMTLTPDANATSRTLIESSLVIKARSQSASATLDSAGDPVVGGGGAANSANHTVTYNLTGSSGAPNGERDFRIHRLFAGFNEELQSGAGFLVSSVTRGIAHRASLASALDPSQVDRFTEIYTVRRVLHFNAENGTVTLDPIFTPIDAVSTSNNTSTSSISGIRLYNTPGSTPTGRQYHFQCVRDPDGHCGFFYLYIGDYKNSTTRTCNGKPPIKANPGNGVLPVALDPRIPAEANCMKDTTNGTAPATGIYDPVTGVVTFKNLAIRLFAPDIPATGFTLDTTLQVDLTTECITDAFVPDPAAKSQRLVDPRPLSKGLDFVTPVQIGSTMPGPYETPLSKYIGTPCSNDHELHGRRLGTSDTTGTLDNDDSDDLDDYPAGTMNFDLAAVGKIRAGKFTDSGSFNQANKMMYMVIKAEVGSFP